MAVPGDGHVLLRLVDLEALEAVDAELLEELECVRSRHVHVGHVVGLVEEHRALLPGPLLVAPVGVFRLHHRVRIRAARGIAQMVDGAAVGAQQLFQVLMAHRISSNGGTQPPPLDARTAVRRPTVSPAAVGSTARLMLSFAELACSRIKASARPLSPRSRASDDRVMLAMREAQHVVHLLEVALVEGQGLRPGERDPAVAPQGLGEQRAPGLRQDQPVEPLVHLRIATFVVLLDATLVENGSAIFEADTQFPQQGLGGAALSDPAHGEPLENTAQVDRIDDVRSGEGADDVTPRLVLREKALQREERQRLSHRGARHAEHVSQRRFGNPLAGASSPRRIISRMRTIAWLSWVFPWAGMLLFGSSEVKLGSQTGHLAAIPGDPGGLLEPLGSRRPLGAARRSRRASAGPACPCSNTTLSGWERCLRPRAAGSGQ